MNNRDEPQTDLHLLIKDLRSMASSDIGVSMMVCSSEDRAQIVNAILAAGYSRTRTVSTVAEIKELPALTIVVYDDMANGGLLQTYVVPDDGTVMFKDRYPFHLMTFAGDYVNAEDMPLPLTVVYEVGSVPLPASVLYEPEGK